MTEAEDKDVSEMKTLILSPGVACVSAEMKVQVPGCGLSDPSTNGWQAKTFMGYHLVFVEESLQRSADGSQRHLVHPHELTLVKQLTN